MIKSNPCKICGSTYHTAAFCSQKPKKAIRRKSIKVKIKKSTKKPIKKTVKRSVLIKKLDHVFSVYIRRKDAVNDIARCVTCNKLDNWLNLQNGHYMSRGYYATRWDETNCHVQCAACNVFKKGNYTEYALFMVNKYGPNKLIELRDKAQKGQKFTTVNLQEIIEKYTKLLQSIS